MSINEIQDKIIDDFSPYSESSEKYKQLIKLAKESETLDKSFKTSANAVKGCQSTVWVVSEMSNDGKMRIQGDTDVLITKGILTLILRVYNNQKPDDILSTNLYFLEKIGLKQSLSPQRANGVLAIIEYIRNIAKMNNNQANFAGMENKKTI